MHGGSDLDIFWPDFTGSVYHSSWRVKNLLGHPLALSLIPALLACSIGLAAEMSYFAERGFSRLLHSRLHGHCA